MFKTVLNKDGEDLDIIQQNNQRQVEKTEKLVKRLDKAYK